MERRAAEPLRALEALGRASIAFARAEPAYFAAMFETGGAQVPTQAVQVEGSRAFGALRAACAALAERLPPARRPPVDMTASHLWAMAHGAATLFARPGARSPIEAEDLLEASIAVYRRGLGLLPPDPGAAV